MPTEARKQEDKPPARVQAAIGVAGSLIALAAYIYLLGGLVLWLKFTAARLPTDETVGVLDANRLLAVGLKALVFELLFGGALFALAFATLLWVRKGQLGEAATAQATEAKEQADQADAAAQAKEAEAVEAEEKSEEAKSVQRAKDARAKAREAEKAALKVKEVEDRPKLLAWKLLLNGVIVWILVGSAVALVFHPWPGISALVGLAIGCAWVLVLLNKLEYLEKHSRRRWWIKTVLTVVAICFALVFLAAPAGVGVLVLLAFLHTSHVLKKLPTVSDPAKLVPAVLVITGGLSLVVATYTATTPVALDNALVVMEGNKRLEGGYIGRSSEGVYVAACKPRRTNPEVSGPAHLRIVSPDRIRRVVIGGPGYVFDYDTHPSLVDYAVYLIGHEPLDEWERTVPIDIREDTPVCGLDGFFDLAERPRDPRSGLVAQHLEAFGAGSVRLHGDEIEPQEGEAVTNGDQIVLPIVPNQEARLKHRCNGPFRTRIEVQLTLDESGEVESQKSWVKMSATPHSRRGRRICSYPSIHPAEEVALQGAALNSNAR